MRLSTHLLWLIFLTACAVGGNVEDDVPKHGKASGTNVGGLAILELNAVAGQPTCTAAFLTSTILLTSATCLGFQTTQGQLGDIQSAETSEFREIDTIWSLSGPSEPTDLGLVRLKQAPSNVTAFQLKPNLVPSTIVTRYGSVTCQTNDRSVQTVPVDLPATAGGLCNGGSGGVIFDTYSRQLIALHTGIGNSDRDQFTELSIHAQRILQGVSDLLAAPAVVEKPTTESNEPRDICAIEQRYNNGICDTACDLEDPDCAIDTTQPAPCQPSNSYLDGQCPENCPTDPDCLRTENTAQPEDQCEALGLYNDGRCDSCPEFDPDCDQQAEQDFCEQQSLYNDGRCHRCPRPDPDCDEQNSQPTESQPAEFDLCILFGAYGNGTCDFLCPRPDPDCSTTNGGDDNTPADTSVNPPVDDSDGNPGTQATQSSSNDLCELLNWYNDGECDTVCHTPDPDCTQ